MKQRAIRMVSIASGAAGLLIIAGCSTDIFSSSFLSEQFSSIFSPHDGLDKAHALVTQALAENKSGDAKKALDDLDSAIALNVLPPEELARARYDRGVMLDELGRTDDALAEYTQALKLEPKFAEALNNRGNLYRRKGDYDSAKSDYDASLAAGDKELQYPYYGLGLIAEARGDADMAEDCYRKALKADPTYSLASERLAQLTAPRPPSPVTPVNYTSSDPIPVLRPSIDSGPPLRPAVVASTSAALIQLGAYRDETIAADNWNRLLAQTSGILSGLKPRIVPVDVPEKGHFYRLRAEVGDKSAASQLCDRLKSRGIACMPVKG